MSEVFEFETKDFQVVEDIEYDETIQRPESIRFYTLNEQVTDAYEKLVPKGRITKFQLEVLKNEVDRLRDLYTSHIIVTADDYRLREPVYGKNFDWIFPVYATNTRRPYSYEASYNPLFDEAHIKLPNFYRSLLLGLPKPYQSEAEGTPFPITKPTEFVNTDGEEPERALPLFKFTRTQRHEDGRFDVLPVTMANTADLVDFVGYYAKKRAVDVPNPLPDHPFLKSAEAVMVETTAPLDEVVPSLDAVLTHAVPVTKDPYVEGLRYLKVYDIKLSDIPWKSWKSRFPPADSSDIATETLELAFPKSESDKPSEKLLEYYRPYFPGLSARYWLMNQLDGGELVVQMLLSQAGKNGTVELRLSADAEHTFPTTTIAECDLTGLDFQAFQTRGILRRTWTVGKKDMITFQCVPLELLRQERKQDGFKGRLQWKEGTSNDILETYLRALKKSVVLDEVVKKEPKTPITPAREVPQQRKDVITILEDKERFADDKLKDITQIIQEAIFSNKVYTDKDGAFVVCQHTLAILGGELAADRRLFYDTWTAKVDGFRVCRSCGEQINADVLEDQEEFSDTGRLMKHAEALPTTEFHGHGIADQITSLASLKNAFDFNKASDEVFFLLISVLHVLPDTTQLLPILDVGRRFSVALKDAAAIAGIVQAVLLLQSHRPALIPRRSFGSKSLTLSGFPRDSDEADGYTIVDSMILVLTKTLDAYPTSFKGASASIMRLVLSDPKKVRTLTVRSLTALLKQSPEMRKALNAGKSLIPVDEPMKPITMIPGDLVMPPPEAFGTIIHPPTCPSYRAYWTTSHLPQIRQDEVPLRPNINQFARPDSNRKLIAVSESERVKPVPVKVGDKDVLRRLKLMKTGATDNWRTNVMIANRLSTLFAIPNPTRTLDPDQKNDDLRDITKGYVYDLIAEISKDAQTKTRLQEAMKKDATLVLLFADVKEAKAITNTLRAKERTKLTDLLREMNDNERAVTKELLDRGLAGMLITSKDRSEFAKEAAQKEAEDADTGVGRPVDYEEQGELPVGEDRVEGGNYGDYSNAPNTEGRDYVDADMFDDDDRGI
jgi:hypothetical protein